MSLGTIAVGVRPAADGQIASIAVLLDPAAPELDHVLLFVSIPIPVPRALASLNGLTQGLLPGFRSGRV